MDKIKMLKPYLDTYHKLQRFLPSGWQEDPGMIEAYKLYSDGFMPLSIEFLGRDSFHDNRVLISLCHYYEQNGDLMRDPDIVISVSTNPAWPVAEAMSYQQDGLGVYQEVYITKGDKKLVSPKLKKELNKFLLQWLRNLKNQGFAYDSHGSLTVITPETKQAYL
jgi:hypothetical protein